MANAINYETLKKEAEADSVTAYVYIVATGTAGAFFGIMFLVNAYSLYEIRKWPNLISLTTGLFIISLVCFLIMGLIFLPNYNEYKADVDKYKKLKDEQLAR